MPNGIVRDLQQRLDDAQVLIDDLADTPGLVPLLSSLNQEISHALVSHLTLGLLESSSTTAPGTESARIQPVQALDKYLSIIILIRSGAHSPPMLIFPQE